MSDGKPKYAKCVNCTQPDLYRGKYGGYCLDCSNAGADDKDAEIERLKAALAAEVADLERDLAYYREGTCWGWGTLVKQTERALERLRAALAGEGPKTESRVRCPVILHGERCCKLAGHDGDCKWANGD